MNRYSTMLSSLYIAVSDTYCLPPVSSPPSISLLYFVHQGYHYIRDKSIAIFWTTTSEENSGDSFYLF
jgi:hypothetical protein